MTPVKLDPFKVVNISLLLHTVVAAGLGKKEFLDKLTKEVEYLRAEYKEQVPIKEQGEVSLKIMKHWGVKVWERFVLM